MLRCLRTPHLHLRLSKHSRQHAIHTCRKCIIVHSRDSLNLNNATGTVARQLRWEEQIALGRLVIRPLEQSDIQAAGVVLARAFAGSSEAVALDGVLDDIQGVLHDALAQHEDGGLQQLPEIFLIARLYPGDPRVTALPPGQDSRLVG
ncbi:hypothetical protein Agub_g12388, partial [Astrephomene gubernaculifera]